MAPGFSFGFDDSDIEEDIVGWQALDTGNEGVGGPDLSQVEPKLHSLDDLVCGQIF